MSESSDALRRDVDWLRRYDLLPLPKDVIQGWLRAQAKMRVDLQDTRVAASRCPACDVGIHRECLAETEDGWRCPCACRLEDD